MTLLRFATASRPFLTLSILAAVAAASGCASNNKQALLEALRDYNDHVRWQRTTEVAGYMYDSGQRSAYFARIERLPEVRVSDCRIRAVRLQGDAKAHVLVTIDWYSLRSARAHRTVMRQTWNRKDGKWRVTNQRWVQGATFPLFAAAPTPVGRP